MALLEKTYLGDAVYVEDDGYGLILTTEDGYSVTNRIYIEPSVYESLERFVGVLRAKQRGEIK